MKEKRGGERMCKDGGKERGKKKEIGGKGKGEDRGADGKNERGHESLRQTPVSRERTGEICQVEQIAPQGPRLDWKSRLVLQLFTMAFSTLSFGQRDPMGQEYRCEEKLP